MEKKLLASARGSVVYPWPSSGQPAALVSVVAEASFVPSGRFWGNVSVITRWDQSYDAGARGRLIHV